MSTTIGFSAEPNAPSPEQQSSREKPRWGAFSVAIGAIVLLVAVPSIAIAIVPSKVEGVVGVYERIILHSEPDEGGSVAGFIAPQGWTLLDSSDGEDATGGQTQRLESQSGNVAVSASVHSPVESTDKLLREGTPIGATLAPILTLDSAPLLAVSLLEYDLDAGDGVSQRIAVCEVLKNSACLVFEVEIAATLASTGGGPLLPEIAAMVASAEVQPHMEVQS